MSSRSQPPTSMRSTGRGIEVLTATLDRIQGAVHAIFVMIEASKDPVCQCRCSGWALTERLLASSAASISCHCRNDQSDWDKWWVALGGRTMPTVQQHRWQRQAQIERQIGGNLMSCASQGGSSCLIVVRSWLDCCCRRGSQCHGCKGMHEILRLGNHVTRGAQLGFQQCRACGA